MVVLGGGAVSYERGTPAAWWHLYHAPQAWATLPVVTAKWLSSHTPLQRSVGSVFLTENRMPSHTPLRSVQLLSIYRLFFFRCGGWQVSGRKISCKDAGDKYSGTSLTPTPIRLP